MRKRVTRRPWLPRKLIRTGVLQPAGVPLLQHLDAVVDVQRAVRRRVQDPPEDVLERGGRRRRLRWQHDGEPDVQQ